MMTDLPADEFDVIVIGSYAGLSAAMQLGQARKRVLVIDAGLRRNRFAQTSHGFLGQDGRTAVANAAGGRSAVLDGLFTPCRTQMASPTAEQLGCAFDEGPLGAVIRTDAAKETKMPGVFACGDAARLAASIAFAVGDGIQAGMSAHQSLVFR